MENQHQLISGYRDLTKEEIDLINDIKKNRSDLGLAIDVIEQMPNADRRMAAIARTQIQLGLMALIRAIARPQGFC